MSLIYKKSNKGFTLIELLVVIAIIGVLASVVLGSLDSARVKARDTKRLAEIRNFQTALELAYSDNGIYPISGWTCSYESTWQTSNLAVALEPYMKNLPVDPTNDSGLSYTAGNNSYCYYADGYGGPGKWYTLVFQLEDDKVQLDELDGVTACSGQEFDYGGDDGYILTYGVSCI